MLKSLALLGLLGFAAIVPLAAAPILLCSTGFATATFSGCGSAISSAAANNLTADGNWYISSNTSGTFLSQSYVTVNGSYPLPNPGSWLANNASTAAAINSGSSWLMPSANQTSLFTNGQYYFATQFSVAAADRPLVRISGSWLADDYGTGIYLNGVLIPQASLPSFGSYFGPMVNFEITAASAAAAGTGFFSTNTLVFGFRNDSTNGGLIFGSTGPTGMRVLFTEVSAVPEPGSAALGATSLLAFALYRHRKSLNSK